MSTGDGHSSAVPSQYSTFQLEMGGFSGYNDDPGMQASLPGSSERVPVHVQPSYAPETAAQEAPGSPVQGTTLRQYFPLVLLHHVPPLSSPVSCGATDISTDDILQDAVHRLIRRL